MSKMENHHKVISYVSGFVLSIILTLAAYFIVTQRIASGWAAMWLLSALAVAQLSVQLMFFLHLNRQQANRERLQLFNFAVLVVVIVVGGTLWIMNNLHYDRGMDNDMQQRQEIEQDIVNDEGIDLLQTD